MCKISEKGQEMIRATNVYHLYPSPTFWIDRISKAFKSFSLMHILDGAINSHTILRGALKSWDPNRLLSGKHVTLHTAGAEHIQIKSQTNEIVDAHFLEASQFVSNLEKMGGQRKTFQLKFPETSLYSTKSVFLKLKNGMSIEMEEFSSGIDKKKRLILDTQYGQMGKKVISDKATGKFYAVPNKYIDTLYQSSYYTKNADAPFTGFEIALNSTISQDSLKLPFSGFQFSKDSSEWKTAKSLLEGMGLEKSNWTIHETSEMMYLVRNKDQAKFDLFSLKNILNDNLILEAKDPEPELDKEENGTILLSNAQNDIYEQNLPEMLTFALEGMNVMVYNHPNKGLSTGSPYRQNINASIEAAYQFLSKVKNIPDEKILAKGLCFGAAPTAWLGKKHPTINLLLDQSPANFQDIPAHFLNKWSEKVLSKPAVGIQQTLKAWLAKLLYKNTIINGIATAILKGYDIPEDLRLNRGHKLFNIAVPDIRISDEAQRGGDEIVPEYHLDLMLDAIPNTEDQEIRLSLSPGMTHASAWWESPESTDSILGFLDKIGLRKRDSFQLA